MVRFTLTYDGPLSTKSGAQGKQAVREQVRPQLRRLWNQQPLGQVGALATWEGLGPAEPGQRGLSIVTRVGEEYFAPLVSSQLKLIAELDVLFLRPGRPGVLTGHGDIDNRLKVLFDGLSVPRPQMAANAPCSSGFATRGTPFDTLLEDDSLVTRVNVDTATLLSNWPGNEIRAIVRVDVRPTELTYANMPLL